MHYGGFFRSKDKGGTGHLIQSTFCIAMARERRYYLGRVFGKVNMKHSSERSGGWVCSERGVSAHDGSVVG